MTHDHEAVPLPLREESSPASAGESAPSYRWFIFTSLALAGLAGFALAVALPLSGALEWNWGRRWLALAQAHGQTQLLGWAGMFILGMAYRLMPRFSGRPLAFAGLRGWSWGLLALSLLLRLAAQPAGVGAGQQAALVLSGVLGLGAATAFATVVLGTLLHRQSRAEATGYFFVAAAGAFVVQAGLNLAMVSLMVQRGENLARYLEDSALVFLQVYGLVLMVILGVATRAVPTFSGLARPNAAGKVLTVIYGTAVALVVVVLLWRAGGASSMALVRVEDGATIVVAGGLAAAVWLAGIFRPAAVRLRPASQPHLWLLRSAFAWLVVAAGLMAYYGLRAAAEERPLSPFEADGIRHAVGAGVVTPMIMGMAMLVLPEFAVRRMHHPHEPFWPFTLAVMLSAAAALRVAPALTGLHWLDPDRYWPMAVAGGLAETAIVIFAALFLRNYLELRRGIVPLPPAATPGPRLAQAQGRPTP